MNLREKKGSISIFVLVMLLFMSAFLIISFAANINKGKSVREQFNIISGIYSKTSDEQSYTDTYSYLRNKNKETITASAEYSSTLELEKTYEDNLINYRIYGSGIFAANHNLPTEYQELEFIENNGTQYIDTGFIPNSNTTIEMKASNNSTGNSCLWCARTNQQVKSYMCTLMGGNQLLIDYDSTRYPGLTTLTNDWAYIYKQDKDQVYVDGELIKILSETEFSCEYNMYLLATYLNGGTSNITNIGSVKIYYCKIWDNGTLVRDFIPCYRKSDGAVGLFDTVSGGFYNSKSSGNFSKGSSIQGVGNLVTEESNENYGKYVIPIKLSNIEDKNIIKDIYLNSPLEDDEYIDFKTNKVVRNDGTEESIELPELSTYEDYTKIEVLTQYSPSKIEVEYTGYTLIKKYITLEYIESNGTQYIDTGFIPNSNTTIEMKASKNSTGNACLWCARTNQQVKSYMGMLMEGNQLLIDYDSTRYQKLTTLTNDLAYIYKQDKNQVYVNGELIKTLSESEFSCEYNMYLLATHIKYSSIQNIGNVKLYYCKIWNDGTLVRDFIPVQRIQDGKIGMYDSVTDKFYPGFGAEDFIAGPIV